MTGIERIQDWLMACTIWLAILTVISIVVLLLYVGYLIAVIPLAIYNYVRRKLRGS